MAIDTVWVVAETGRSRPRRSTLELVTAASRVGRRVEAVTWGDDDGGGGDLGSYGVARVHHVSGAGAGLPGPTVAAAIAERVLAGHGPEAVLAASSPDGREVLGRLSARLDRPVLANAVGLEPADPPVAFNAFGAHTLVTARFTGPGPYLFLVRPGSFPPAPPSPWRRAEVVDIESWRAAPTAQARIVARHQTDPEAAALDGARVVVAGGRGLASADRFALVRQLAELLRGAPAATGAAVDAGWAPPSWQVGQTGRAVAPELYVACGISGAAQHTVGMRAARHVVAINTDPGAPIFELADIGIVGDAGDVLSRLIDAIRSRRAGYDS